MELTMKNLGRQKAREQEREREGQGAWQKSVICRGGRGLNT